MSDAQDQQTAPGGAPLPPVGHEGTERPIHRPVAPDDPQADSGGTKHCPTSNNLRGLDAAGPMCVVRATAAGKATATTLAEREGDRVPPGRDRSQALGVQGVVLADVTMIQANQQPRGGELTPPENAPNRRIASSRIRIDHAMGGVKRDRSVQDKIRLLKDSLRDTVMETCGGLHNDRLQYRPRHYAS